MKKIWKRSMILLLALIMGIAALPIEGLAAEMPDEEADVMGAAMSVEAADELDDDMAADTMIDTGDLADEDDLSISDEEDSDTGEDTGEETDESDNTCGQFLTWALEEETGVLTISGNGEMSADWNMEQAPWYEDRSLVRSVIVEEGVTSVGSYAFQGCTNLTQISLADSVRSIGQCAFFDCSALTEVIIPQGITEIPYRTFYLCASLERAEIPSTVTVIGNGAFDQCAALKDVHLPVGLVSLGKSAFAGCDSLKKIELPDGIHELAMNTFYGCSNLSGITLPEGFTALGAYALSNCTSLVVLDLPESLTTIGAGAIGNCSRLESLVIPEKVTSIGTDAFAGCTGLDAVWFSSNASSGSDWFGEMDCTVYYPGSNPTWDSARLNAAGGHINWIAWDPSSGAMESYATPVVTEVVNESDGVKISWNAVKGAKTYGVYASSGESGSLTRIAAVTDTGYTDTNTVGGTSYRYTVCVLENNKVASGYDREGIGICRLGMPTVSVSAQTDGVKVSWNRIKEAAGYRIYRKTAESDWVEIADISSNSTVSYLDTSIKEAGGGAYYYTVRACKGTDMSGFTVSEKVLYLAQPEVTLSVSSNGVCVSWSESKGAASYRIYRKTAGGSWTTLTAVTDGTTFCYTDTSIQNNSGTTYYYTVRAYMGSIRSTYDSTKSITFLLQPAPSLSNTAAGIKVSWSKINGADGYYVYRKTASTGWKRLASLSNSAAGYLDTTVQDSSGTTYYYTVRAHSGSALSAYATDCRILRLAQPEVTLSMGSDGVNVSWDKVEGAASYRIYRKTIGSGWTSLAAVTAGTSLRYTDTSVQNSSGTYYYTVRACSGAAQSSYDGTKSIQVLRQPCPKLSNAATGVNVSWSKVDGAGGYYVYRKTASTGWKKLESLSDSAVSYLDTTIQNDSGTTYYYTVRAHNGSALSSYTTTCSILYLAQPEVTLSMASEGVSVSWNEVEGATGYRIYRKTAGSSWTSLAAITDGTTLRYTDTSIRNASGTIYFYTVRAYRGAVQSTYDGSKTIKFLSQPSFELSNTSAGVQVSWNNITGADGYRVYRKTASSGWIRIAAIENGSMVSYLDEGVESGDASQYLYTVRAYSGSYLSTYQSGKTVSG